MPSQKEKQAQSHARRRPTSMPQARRSSNRIPARSRFDDDEDDFEEFDEPRSIHDTATPRVIAAGGVEVVWFAAGSFATAAFIGTRQNVTAWSLGAALVSFFAAGGAREDATIRDVSLGVLAGSSAVLTLRMMGKMNLSSGQK